MKRISPEEMREIAHTCDLKNDKDGYVIADVNTHSEAWINEMLKYGMSVFKAIAQAQLDADRKEVEEILEKIDGWFKVEWKDLDNETATYWRVSIENLMQALKQKVLGEV